MRELKIKGGTGLTSCLSVRLDQACAYRAEYGHYPDRIDSSAQFEMYRSNDGSDISHLLLDSSIAFSSTGLSQFNHGWQYAWYDEIGLDELSHLAWTMCRPSRTVIEAAASLPLDPDRCVILYRGNDKAKEIGRTEYGDMIEASLACGFDRFHVQTDEQDFLNYCIEHLPDVTYWPHLPRIHRNLESYVIPGQSKARPQFAHDFLAAILAMSRAPSIICTTGNVSLWTMLYRGHTAGVWQAHGRCGITRHLHP